MSIRQVLQQGLHWASKIYEHRQVLVERFDVGGGDSIISDLSWLQENFLCLLSNGLKYSEAGPVKVRITKQKELMNIDWTLGSGYQYVTPDASGKSRKKKERWLQFGSATQSSHPLLARRDEEEESVYDYDLEGGMISGISQGENKDNKNAGSAVSSIGHQSSEGGSSAQPSPPRFQDMLRVEVEDYGMAMTEEVARNLFCPPANSDERKMGGTGLGLYCIAERIRALNGKYGVVLGNMRRGNSSFSDRTVNVSGTRSLVDSAVWGERDEFLESSFEENRGNVVWWSVPFQAASPASSYSSNDMTEMAQSSRRSVTAHGGSRSIAPEQKETESEAASKLPLPQLEILKTSSCCKDPKTAGLSLDTSPPVFSSETNVVNMEHNKSSLAAVPPPLKVLIVDDSGLILKVLKATLQKRGHDVSVTTNGYEAL
ncbi:hypothetical protein EON64_19720, partial [archaeon]